MQGIGSQNNRIQALNSAGTSGGAVGGGVAAEPMSADAKEASAQGASGGAKFGDVWKQMQSKYGAKPERPKEIKKTLGKDDFLRIMITQMKNQDPTQPFKAEQFATELAQYTSVEQLQNMNQQLGKMANQNQPLEKLAMTNLIGKTLTVDKERFPHTEGQNENLSFVIPKDAAEVKVAIIAENGETVHETDMGTLKKGEHSITWDGTKKGALPAKSGNYQYRVDAKDALGGRIETNPQSKTQVVGVSFEGTEPVLLVGNPQRPEKVMMRNVVRIEMDAAPALIPGAQSLASAVQSTGGAPAAEESVPPAKGPNVFTFKKGEGSSTPDSIQALPSEAQEALARYQAGQSAGGPPPGAPQSGPHSAPSEHGFPSGLHSGDDRADQMAAERIRSQLSQNSQNGAKIEKGGERR